MRKNKKNNSKGFTLVEVTVGGTVMVVIAAAIAGLQYILAQNQVVVYNGTVKLEYANTSLSAIIREIRTARTSDNGSYVIESASTNSLIFYSDIDFDGETEKVRYFIQANQLLKGVIEPEGFPVTYPASNEKIKVVVDGVQNGTTPIFYYYNENWPFDAINNPLQSPVDVSEIHMIKVYFRINTKANNPSGDYVLDSTVEIRSLKNNL